MLKRNWRSSPFCVYLCRVDDSGYVNYLRTENAGSELSSRVASTWGTAQEQHSSGGQLRYEGDEDGGNRKKTGRRSRRQKRTMCQCAFGHDLAGV